MNHDTSQARPKRDHIPRRATAELPNHRKVRACLAELTDEQLQEVLEPFKRALLEVYHLDLDIPEPEDLDDIEKVIPRSVVACLLYEPIQDEQEKRERALNNAEIEIRYNGHVVYPERKHERIGGLPIVAQCLCGWESEPEDTIAASRVHGERHAAEHNGALAATDGPMSYRAWRWDGWG